MKIDCFFLVLLAFAACGPRNMPGQRVHQAEQRHFSAEDTGVNVPVPMPPGVLDALRKDESIRSVLQDHGLSGAELPPSWFSAASVHLGNSSESDFIVKGEGPISGANVTTFWVFCAAHQGYEEVLKAVAHDLLVQNERKNGRFEIQTISSTALKVTTISFRFDGKRYKQYRAQTEDIR